MSAKSKILIIGDSFAADWSVKYNDYPGWPTLLSHDYDITNLAQAGVSEYKILIQVESVCVKSYDLVIVSHTSPYRVHTYRHPVHSQDLLHSESDLILNDCEYHSKSVKHWFNRSLQHALGFFKYHFDEKYYETVYTLFRDKINSKLEGVPVIVINNLPNVLNFASEPIVLDFCSLWNTEPGVVNHFSEQGNLQIYKTIQQTIKSIKEKNNG